MLENTLGKITEAIAGMFLIVACIALRPLLRKWYSRWGATPDEVVQNLPGDEYVPHRRGGYTQAISIKAPAGAVWRWLVQVGQDKGGFYSYELLENLVGCNIHNTDHILAEYQDIKIGDKLVMHPKAPAIPVIIVEPEKVLAYGGSPDDNTSSVWIFYISQKGDLIRLISRWSFDHKPGIANKLAYGWLLEPVAAVMQRKMLLGIKKRAETAIRELAKSLS